jgi:hypothetical protein
MAIFNSYVSHYQRVAGLLQCNYRQMIATRGSFVVMLPLYLPNLTPKRTCGVWSNPDYWVKEICTYVIYPVTYI